MNEFLTFLKANKEALTIIAATIGGVFALWRWMVDQRWRRVQYAQQLIREFFTSQNNRLALEMLDVRGRVQLPPLREGGKNRSVRIDEPLLIRSFLTLDQTERFDEPEFSIRMIFDRFFTSLSQFQHHIDAGLIKVRDVRPYLEYWIKGVRGYGPIYTIVLAWQIDAFLRAFDYKAVLKLLERMGGPVKDWELSLDAKIKTNPCLANCCCSMDKDWLNTKSDIDGALRRYELYSVVKANYFSIVGYRYIKAGGEIGLEIENLLWDNSKREWFGINAFFRDVAADGQMSKGLCDCLVAALNEDTETSGAGRTASDESEGRITSGLTGMKAALARSTESGKSSGLIFHFSPAGLPHARHPHIAFVHWKEFASYLSETGISVFGGYRPGNHR